MNTSPECHAGQLLATLRKSPRPLVGVKVDEVEDLASLNTLGDQNSRVKFLVENQSPLSG